MGVVPVVLAWVWREACLRGARDERRRAHRERFRIISISNPNPLPDYYDIVMRRRREAQDQVMRELDIFGVHRARKNDDMVDAMVMAFGLDDKRSEK